MQTDRLHGCLHRGSSGQTVIDQNDNASTQVGERTSFSVLPLASLQFRLLLTCDRLDRRVRNAVRPHNVVAEDTNTARGDRTNGVLGMSRHAEFADDENVEWRVEGFGDFERDWHAASRQRQNDDIVTSGVLPKLRRELDSRFASIRKGTA